MATNIGVQAVAVQGVQLQTGNGQSPETFVTIANVSKFTLPTKAKVVDVSNVSNLWQMQIPTLLMIGDVQLDVFWVPEEGTHDNSSPYGLRYCLINKLKKDFQFIYNDGNESTDAFTAYVTSFQITGQEADVLKATITLSGTSTPSFV